MALPILLDVHESVFTYLPLPKRDCIKKVIRFLNWISYFLRWHWGLPFLGDRALILIFFLCSSGLAEVSCFGILRYHLSVLTWSNWQVDHSWVFLHITKHGNLIQSQVDQSYLLLVTYHLVLSTLVGSGWMWLVKAKFFWKSIYML